MTGSLVAKPIIKDQYWVVTDGDKKVGNVIADSSGFEVKLNGTLFHYSKADEVQKNAKIKFEAPKLPSRPSGSPYPEFPTTARVYNSMLDVKRKLHLFTKSKKSKCYHAAGWFVIDQNGNKQIEFCPKYIFIRRYDYLGPFKTQQEAESFINT